MTTQWIDVSDTTPRVAYTATASQTLFTVPFVFFSNSDLIVYQNDDILTLTTDYTVTGATVEAGGTVTLLVGATVGDSVMIVRDVPIEQTSHIPPSGPLNIGAVNTQLSKMIAIDQQLKDLLDRTIRLPDSEETADQRIPALADRASKFAAWSAEGTMIGSAGSPPATVPVSTLMQTALSAANTTEFFDVFFADATAFLNLFGIWTQFGTRASAQATSVASIITTMTIAGYTTRGDAPIAPFTRVASQPSHAGKIQTADGGWWVISGDTLYPEWFGAVGDGVTDDLPALQAAETARLALAAEIRFLPKTYYLNNPNSQLLLRPRWQGAEHDATVIVMDGASAVCMFMTGAGGISGGYMRDFTFWAPSSRTTGQALRLDGDATYQPDDFVTSNLRITGTGSWDIPLFQSGTDRPAGGGLAEGLRGVMHNNLFIGRDISVGIVCDHAIQMQFYGGGIYGGTSNSLQFSGNIASNRTSSDNIVAGFKINGLLSIDDNIASTFNVLCGSVGVGADASDNSIQGVNSGATSNSGTNTNLAALA